ncbi:molybdenum cofactor guanylyltransferase [Nakamurella multipartita]|uniref:Molybdopterin-guanine dinucleotide biosynthesis protein A n=1 Tax=Nakamurella multipartita (strain ATCC 700099 / DSM 44233 / CIP 104796 / JCM 9543 / NBRC 105858 / Y-104) TaxID=479431 RepID=C8XKB2_NAKMY|nr:NTP transferase domain-containing protein [Nakamurella multipartita]ACV78674.1 molybdopterin-guanine dinucleotide biosynthesis protein A [Nakamurella multipartita DSM 44233]
MPSASAHPSGSPGPSAAVVLAGGRGRRLGGVDKPALRIGERTLLDVALAAVAGVPTVVVGPDRDVPPGVLVVREDPPGGGPAAALAAGVAALPARPSQALVVVLAADLTAIDAATVAALCARVGRTGAVLLDGEGRSQWLAGVWRWGALTGALRQQPSWHQRSVRDLLGPLDPVPVAGREDATADVDTPEDLRRLRSSSSRLGPS